MEGEVPPIYLDYNATTPIDPEVATAMLPFVHEQFGNPSSSHYFGRRTKAAIEEARSSVAALIGCHPDEVVFTSGGTESNNWAIKGAAGAVLKRRGGVSKPGKTRTRIVTSAVEHPAVSEVVEHLAEERGIEAIVLPVDGEGRVATSDVLNAATDETAIVSIMHANNEVGSLQPIAEMGKRLRERGIVVHTDASQSVGKVPISWEDLHVDLLTIAGHKLYAPKGVGALIVRRGTVLEKFMHGAGHERGLRAGTENTILIVGLGKACEVALRDMGSNVERMLATRARLVAELERLLREGGVRFRVNGPLAEEWRLPNTLSISLAGVDGAALMSAIAPRLACSTGSACHAGHITMSPVLTAMGVPPEYGACTLRLSTGRYTTPKEVDEAARLVAETAIALHLSALGKMVT